MEIHSDLSFPQFCFGGPVYENIELLSCVTFLDV